MNKSLYIYTNGPRKPIALDEVLEKTPSSRLDKAQPLQNLCAQGEMQRVPVLH